MKIIETEIQYDGIKLLTIRIYYHTIFINVVIYSNMRWKTKYYIIYLCMSKVLTAICV